MNSSRFVRFMRGGHWICKHGNWFKVSQAAYRRHRLAGAVGFCTDAEDWTTDEANNTRNGLYVLAFCAFLVSVIGYAAGFPL